MAGNSGYQISSGSQTVTLPPYTAFGTEIMVSMKWENVWLRKFALLAMLQMGGANFNKGGDLNGTQMLLPILEANSSTAATGVATANEFTAITPYATNGATQAAYQIAHYRHAFYVKASETKQINNKRGNFMDLKVQQLNDSFINLLANDLAGTAADSESNVLGIQQPLSTSNTVGQINQSTDTDWQSNVQTGVGAFSLDLLDWGIDAVDNRAGKVDLILLAYSASNNLFAKARAAIAPAERLVNQEFKAKYGFTNIDYLGATLVSDGRLTAGVIAGFDTSTWYWHGDTSPKPVTIERYPGTDAMEHMYNLWCALGTNNPAKNFRETGAS